MNDPPEDAKATVLAVLGGIAPEANLAALDPKANLRRALDLDSIDFQNFLIALVKTTGVDIPDRVAPSLVTLDACVGHLIKSPGVPLPLARSREPAQPARSRRFSTCGMRAAARNRRRIGAG